MLSDPKPERRLEQRRKPTIVLETDEAILFIERTQYTGSYVGHAINGKTKRIELPNPQGY